MDNQLFWIINSSVSGGMVRGIVGVTKALWPYKKEEFRFDYFLFTLLLSGFIGAVAGILADHSNQVAFLAGYAGPDFIESLYKLKFVQISET